MSFTHVPGLFFCLPGSTLICQVFPARVSIYDATYTPIAHVPINVGPLEQFLVVQDVDKGHIRVSGFSRDGFCRYCIFAGEKQGSWGIAAEKGPIESCGAKIPCYVPVRERLYLGVDKTPCWPELRYRCCMRELLPLWYSLGQVIPVPDGDIFTGESLATRLRDAIQQGKGVFKAAKELFLAGFYSGFAPRLFDADYQGFLQEVVHERSVSPLLLLSSFVPLIRSLFFEEQGSALLFLPKLPHEAVSGSLASFVTRQGHRVRMAWSKRLIREIILEAGADIEQPLSFQKGVRQFCVRSGKKEKGIVVANHGLMQFQKGKTYLINKFIC